MIAYRMGRSISELSDSRLDLQGLRQYNIQRCHGCTGSEAILLQEDDHDACGFDREAVEVSLWKRLPCIQ